MEVNTDIQAIIIQDSMTNSVRYGYKLSSMKVVFMTEQSFLDEVAFELNHEVVSYCDSRSLR